MKDHAARRCALVLLLAAGASLPAFGLLAADLPVNNDPETWLPAAGANRTAYEGFRRTFGTEEAILVAAPADTSPATLSALRVRLEMSPLIRHACSPDSIAAIMRETNVPEEEIAGRLTGLLRSEDGEWIAVAAGLSEAGSADRSGAVRAVRSAVAAAGLTDRTKVAGVPVVVSELDRLSRPNAVLPYLCGMFALGWVALRWVCGRWGLASILGGIVVWTTLGALAGVRLAGGEMNLILAALPALVLVFGLTASVHLLHYHAAAPGEGLAKANAAVRAAAGPTAWATATTAMGLLSLGLSEVRPVAWFGPAGALGAGLAAIGGLVLTPAAVLLCGGLERRPSRVRPRFHWAEWIVARRRTTLAASAVVVAVCATGLPWLSAKVDAADLLPPSGRVARDHRFVQQFVTPAESFEIVLRPATSAPFGETLARVRAIADDLRNNPAVKHVASAGLFLGDADGMAAANRMAAARSRPEAAAFVTADGAAWRLSVRADCPPGRRTSVVEALTAVCARHAEPSEIVVTGLAPLLEAAETAIHDGFRDSLAAAALLIALAVLLATGDWRVWLVAGVANLVPLAAIFGLLGWAGRAVDVGMMMTASVALGLAVDGTFHLLVRHRQEVRRGRGNDGLIAAAAAANGAGPAVVQAAAIAAAGALALTASPFPPTARFGWLTAALLGAAVLADLLILPALLAGLRGRGGKDGPAVVPFQGPDERTDAERSNDDGRLHRRAA